MSKNYGSKRTVVGAHYGLKDWLAQRVTAVLMAAFTFIVFARGLLPAYARDIDGTKLIDENGVAIALMGYQKWAGIFAPQWMRFLTFVVILALIYHVWIGMRDVLMDYIKPLWLRLSLQVLVLVWLLGCAGLALQVLWRM